jgi:hypothetical protein
VKWQDYQPLSQELPVVGPLGVRLPAPEKKQLPAEKVVAFNRLTPWDACPVELTVVLTKQRRKKPWGIACLNHR